jgi:hypothetical protein
MKTLSRRRFQLSCLPLGFAAAAPSFAQSAAPFEAGAAKRIITPDPLLPISGGMGAPTPATSKQGELTARAIVFRSGSELLAVVSLDLIGFPSVLGDRARKLIPRIAPGKIVIGVTHTHSAPEPYALPDGKGGHTASLEYLDFVAKQVAAAVNEALDNLQPAEIRSATGEAKGKIAYNYYAPDLYDRRANVLQIRAVAGKPIGTLVNYAIHPEILGSGRGILSPDCIGPFYDRVEQSAGGLALFMNSAQAAWSPLTPATSTPRPATPSALTGTTPAPGPNVSASATSSPTSPCASSAPPPGSASPNSAPGPVKSASPWTTIRCGRWSRFPR